MKIEDIYPRRPSRIKPPHPANSVADKPFAVPGVEGFRPHHREPGQEKPEPSPELHQLSLAGIPLEGAIILLMTPLMREAATMAHKPRDVGALKAALERVSYGVPIDEEDRQVLTLAGAIVDDMHREIGHGSADATYRAEELLAQITEFVQAALPYATLRPIVRS